MFDYPYSSFDKLLEAINFFLKTQLMIRPTTYDTTIQWPFNKSIQLQLVKIFKNLHSCHMCMIIFSPVKTMCVMTRNSFPTLVAHNLFTISCFPKQNSIHMSHYLELRVKTWTSSEISKKHADINMNIILYWYYIILYYIFLFIMYIYNIWKLHYIYLSACR